MIIDGSIDSDLNIISGQSIESIDIDDVSLHIDDMDLVSEGIEVLET